MRTTDWLILVNGVVGLLLIAVVFIAILAIDAGLI